ncbi:hypothetical protein GCM10010253_23970 [Streptomyces badius]|uniref:Uncharacterized protein n=1 Tax=Streptomyces badius TaxID=1941 RepID=A0ABQ2T267_STRBA|nr:hypothetical protein GCM10010253_23970 [Streptomyces badius]
MPNACPQGYLDAERLPGCARSPDTGSARRPAYREVRSPGRPGVECPPGRGVPAAPAVPSAAGRPECGPGAFRY